MDRDHTSRRHPLEHEPSDAIAAFALGLLEPAEQASLEAHLASCATCRQELARHEAVVGDLGVLSAAVEPRPEVWTSLVSTIAQDAAGQDAAHVTPRRQFSLSRIALTAAALLAIVSIVTLTALLARTIDERDDARYGEQRMAEYLAHGGRLSPLLPAPAAPAEAQAGNGTLAIAPSNDKAMLVVYDLDPTSDGWAYMAWAERDGDRIRLGEVQVDDRGIGWLVFYPPDPMSTYETVGINRLAPDAEQSEPFLVATVD